MPENQLKPNVILRGPIFPEPVQVVAVASMGRATKVSGKGLNTKTFYDPILSPEQIATLEITPEKEPFDGDAGKFRIGIEAMRLGLAYEYDPYFTLSIARVDPLPHQLEAVYEYFLKLPRIRFLLADDPGAGKTIKAAPMVGLLVKPLKQGEHIYRPGKTPRMLFSVGEEIEPRFGKLGREYKHIVFNKELLASDPTIEWVTPGHPLFEAVRIYSLYQAEDDLRRGAVFFDLYSREPYRLDVYSAAVKDGQGKVVHRRLFVAQTSMDGSIAVRQPTIFLDLIPSDSSTEIPEGNSLPERDSIEQALFDKALLPFLDEIQAERTKEIKTIEDHMDISLNELIARQSQNLMDLQMRLQAGDTTQPFAANIKTAEDRLDDLNSRLERRKAELERERYLNISEVQHHGRAWVLPHPERNAPGVVHMVEDEEIEKIAIQAVIAYEEARGWKVQSVEQENRGFDLISRKPHPEDPQTSVEVRFIEVKGRACPPGKVHPSRPYLHPAYLVGAPASGSLPGGDMRCPLARSC
jgi:hypothetical protein